MVSQRMGGRWIDGRRRWRARTALVAAYLLVLQALVAGFAGAAEAALAPVDAFGTVICSSAHGEVPDMPAPDRTDGHALACCMPGCAMSVSAAAPPPDIAVVLPPMLSADLDSPAIAKHPPTRGAGRTPQNARAPPGSI